MITERVRDFVRADVTLLCDEVGALFAYRAKGVRGLLDPAECEWHYAGHCCECATVHAQTVLRWTYRGVA